MACSVKIGGIPAVIWGDASDRAYLWVHGKMSRKEDAASFAQIAERKGYQVISFDLPQHGERTHEKDRCDVFNGMRDLTIVADHVFSHWRDVSLFACSLGAYFSLNAYPGRPFRRCLFQSPIVDMAYLVRQMMVWFDISEERLAREKEIDTPVDWMSWDYYRFIQTHPVEKWDIPTGILYGGKDNLQPRDVIMDFAGRFSCDLRIAENSEHPFMAEADRDIVAGWLRDSI